MWELIRKYTQIITILFAGVIAVIMIISSISYAKRSVKSLPAPPKLIESVDVNIQNANAIAIKNYTDLTNAIFSKSTDAFNNAVIKGIWPIFNAMILSVLGFIFANKAMEFFKNFLVARNKPD
jgi:uncharacterized protein YacL